MDAYSIPDGAMVSVEASKAMHRRIRDDSALREKLLIAQKMTGKTLLHIAMLRKEDANHTDLMKNQAFAENIMKKRITEEGKDLERSKEAYETPISGN
jgi:hypothetical protein